MFSNLYLFYGMFGVLCVLIITLIALFMISRRSQKIMETISVIMLHPEKAKTQDAVRVLQTIMVDGMVNLENVFQTMKNTFQTQLNTINELKQEMLKQNEILNGVTVDNIKQIAVMAQRFDNTISDLQSVTESQSWQNIQCSVSNFGTTINDLLNKIDVTTQNTTDKLLSIHDQIDLWITTTNDLSTRLQNSYENNLAQMQTITEQSNTMTTSIETLHNTSIKGFDSIKQGAEEYNATIQNNNMIMDEYLTKLHDFETQSKKSLMDQTNTLINTVNVVGGQACLVESSVDKQKQKLAGVVDLLIHSATDTENSVRGISTELTKLTNSFNKDIKEFANDVLVEIKTVSGVANTTLENTKTAASSFADSVRSMATGVRDTLVNMNTAHAQLSEQSCNLIDLSKQTTDQLQPLSELISRYYEALPALTQRSDETSLKLQNCVSNLDKHLQVMQNTFSETTTSIDKSVEQFGKLTGESRQQMIDLMSDYAKAVDTMQTLNKQMMIARASAPMDAIKVAPTERYPIVDTKDFIKQVENNCVKLHELSLDLTKVAGIEIPDIVWKKYHAGKNDIFSAWLAKTLKASDKKAIKNLTKKDDVFNSQAKQFVRTFEVMVNAAKTNKNYDTVITDLLKSDIGTIYSVLHNALQ